MRELWAFIFGLGFGTMISFILLPVIFDWYCKRCHDEDEMR